MHELAVTQSILSIVLEKAQEAKAKKITNVELLVGRLTGYVPECIKLQFDILSHNTVAANANLTFHQPAAKLYCRRCKQEYTTDSFDLVFRGLEIVTGGQREHSPDVLEAQAKEKSVSVGSLASYMEAFNYGMPPHGGFGMGIERVVMQLLGLENIREAVLFPRDTERLTP